MANYRGLLWSLVVIAGTATAAGLAYRYVTRGARHDDEEADSEAASGRRNGAPTSADVAAEESAPLAVEEDQYELLSDEEDVAADELVDAVQTQEQQLMLVAREGNMMLSVLGLIMILLVGLVGVVVAWTSEDVASPTDLPMFQPLMWMALGVFTAATVEVLSASGVTTEAQEIPVLNEKTVFPHDQDDFEMIEQYNARQRASSAESSPRFVREDDGEEEKSEIPAATVDQLIANAEDLFKHNKHRESYNLLKDAILSYPSEIELLWRLSRACNYLVEESSDAEQKKTFAFEGLTYADRAYAVNANAAASNKWKGILTSTVGNFRDLKEKIAGAYVIRDHIKRAIELDPSDATSHNILGQWCLAFADMTWIEKRAAAALFGTPPTATYEEAVQHFLNAEQLSPGFWKKNVFLLAQTYHKMKQDDHARTWIVKARAVPVKTKEDEDVEKQIAALAKKLQI